MLPKLFLKNNVPPSISISVCVQIEKTRRPIAHLRLSHISWISGASSLWNTRWKEISSRGITCICKKQLLLALRPVYQGFIFLHFFFPLRGLWHLLCLCGIVLFLPEISSVTLLYPLNLSVSLSSHITMATKPILFGVNLSASLLPSRLSHFLPGLPHAPRLLHSNRFLCYCTESGPPFPSV